MFKLVIFSIVAIIIAVIVIDQDRDYKTDKCKAESGRVIINSRNDVIGCIK